jgi:hypothetical protein
MTVRPEEMFLIVVRIVRRGFVSVFSGNLLLKSISLALSVSVWGWVQQTHTIESGVWATVDYTWPAGLVLANPAPSRVHLTLEGSRTGVRLSEERDIVVVVDMSEGGEGEQEISFLNQEFQGLPTSTTVLGTNPSSVQIELETRASRDLPLTVAEVGRVADGFRLVGIELEPAVVTVYGPSSVLDELEYVETDGVRVVGNVSSRSVEVGVNLRGNERLLDVEPSVVRANIVVEPINEERLLESVPLFVQGREWEPSVESLGVLIRGPSREIQALDIYNVAVVIEPSVDLPSDQNRIVLTEGQRGGFRVILPIEATVVSTEPSEIELVRVP